MANNWAIVIGINQYHFLQPLKYAKRDAEAMRDFLEREAGFDRVFLFTDDSPEIRGKPTQPFRSNLLKVLHQIFDQAFMKNGDNFWFFFSGHGIRHQEQDYLMPLDADPENVPNTGIATHLVTNYLKSCGADNVVMILDACRSQGVKSGEGIGRQTEAEARQTGVISIFSCSPDQYSYEIEAIEQGAFTYSLLEGLSIRGKCATVEQLNQYLKNRVLELVRKHLGQVRQTPYVIAEPIERSHLILMPKYASLTDIATLKNDAYRAQMRQDWDLAQRLWIRVLASASGQDTEAIEALQFIAIQRATGKIPAQPKPIGQIDGNCPPDDVQPQSADIDSTQTTITQDTFEEDNLDSKRLGANCYARLRDLLKAEDWKRADHETTRLMLEMTGRKTDRWLRVRDISSFSIEDLQAIDQLWMQYSAGKFGFNTQKQIWQTCGSPTTYGQNWDKFGDAIGWRKNGEWDRWGYSLTPSAAPRGHFPRDFAFHSTEGGSARGKQASPVSLTSKLLRRSFQAPLLKRSPQTPSSRASNASETVQEGKNDLSSVRFGTNYYIQLRNLLKSGKWKEADKETANRMLEVMNRQKAGWLDVEHIQNFPYQDLRNIDCLWTKYSEGKFGFSLQKKIYLECGGKLDSGFPGDDTWRKFGERVGWYINGSWIYYRDVTFDISAPSGHLPCLDWVYDFRFGFLLSRRDL